MPLIYIQLFTLKPYSLLKALHVFQDIVLLMSVEYSIEKMDLNLQLAQTRKKGIWHSILFRFDMVNVL